MSASTDAPLVHVVDDDPGVRRSLTLLLRAEGLEARGYPDAESFLAGYDPDRPGCLLLDVRMPGMDGLELQRRLAQSRPELPVIFMTGHGEVPMAVEAMRRGALDFVEKPFDHEALLARVREALELAVRRREELARRRRARELLAGLSPREREVLRLVVQGRLTKQVAAELGISVRTAEVHRARLLHKLGVSSTPEMVRLALDGGILEDSPPGPGAK